MNYKTLHADIVPVSDTADDFKWISKYLVDTHGPTHNTYSLTPHQVCYDGARTP